MAQENVEIVRGLYANWAEVFGGLEDAFYAVFDPGIEWDASRRTFDPGVYHGREGIEEFIAGWREVWASGRIEPVEFIPTEDQVVVPVRLRLVSRTHGQTMNANAAHVWTLHESKIIRGCVFQTRAEALVAAGLSG